MIVPESNVAELCPACGQDLPDINAPCPHCGAECGFCPNPAGCDGLVAATLAACPMCGTANPGYFNPDAPPPAPFVAPAPPAPSVAPAVSVAPVPPVYRDLPADPSPDPAARSSAETDGLMSLLSGMAPTLIDGLNKGGAARPVPPAGPSASAPSVSAPPAAFAPTAMPPAAVAPHLPPMPTLPGVMPADVRVPGLASLSGVAVGASAGVGVRLSVCTERPLRVGERGIVRLRLDADGSVAVAGVRAAVDRSWRPGVRHLPPTRLGTNGQVELLPLDIEPRRPGVEAAVVRVWVTTVEGDTRAAQGTISLTVERDASQRQSVEEMMRSFDRLDRPADTGWRPVDLVAVVADPVPANTPLLPPGEIVATPGHWQVEFDVGGRIAVTLLAVGHTAVFGRGGRPEACWWVRPAPFDDTRWNRISRKHLGLDVQDGRVWASDLSSENGCTLDGRPIPRGPRTALSEDARIELAGVLGLHAKRLGDGRRVNGVVLTRTDALAGRVAYVLGDGTAPTPLATPAGTGGGLWIFASAEKDGRPARLLVGGAEAHTPTAVRDWRSLAVDEPADVAGGRVVVRRRPTPLDQNRLPLGP